MEPIKFRAEAIHAQHELSLGEAWIVTPPSYRALSLGVGLICILLLIYLVFGEYTPKDSVSGVIVTTEGNIAVRSPRAGVVTSVLVEEGSVVKNNQILAWLDSGAQISNGISLQEGIKRELRMRENLLEDQIALIERNELLNRRRLVENIGNLQHQTGLLKSRLAVVERKMELRNDEFEKTKRLAEKGLISESELAQVESNVLEQESDWQALRQTLVQLQSKVLDKERDIQELPAQSQREIANIRSELHMLRVRKMQVSGAERVGIRAAGAGIITASSVREGKRVDEGELLMHIVPRNATFEATLFVPPEAIGFVEVGDQVQVRYDSFPYQDFGLYKATVQEVSRTTTDQDFQNDRQSVRGEGYIARARLNSQEVRGYGKRFALKPGMTLKADILREKRRLIWWVFDPLFEASGHL
jgi:membrane fusion protein